MARDGNFSWHLEELIARNKDPFEFVGRVMREADLTIVNLETTTALGGVPQLKTHVFRSPSSVLHWLTHAGVDVVSLTNNHARDYGVEAMFEMQEHLKKNGILFAESGKNWEEAIQPLIITQKGVVIGILCAGFQKPEELMATAKKPGTAGLRWKKILPLVRALRSQVDYLIFFLFIGGGSTMYLLFLRNRLLFLLR